MVVFVVRIFESILKNLSGFSVVTRLFAIGLTQ
jgi:hypothetical protein